MMNETHVKQFRPLLFWNFKNDSKVYQYRTVPYQVEYSEVQYDFCYTDKSTGNGSVCITYNLVQSSANLTRCKVSTVWSQHVLYMMPRLVVYRTLTEPRKEEQKSWYYQTSHANRRYRYGYLEINCCLVNSKLCVRTIVVQYWMLIVGWLYR